MVCVVITVANAWSSQTWGKDYGKGALVLSPMLVNASFMVVLTFLIYRRRGIARSLIS